MYTIFSEKKQHKITEANINFYASPLIHPKRTMKEHDFIYILQGEWKFGQNEETFSLTKDNLLILSANNTHFGISPCSPNTKTMYFHVSCENDFTDTIPRNGICIESVIDASANPNIKKFFSEIVNCHLQHKLKKANIYFELLLCELCETNIFYTNNSTALCIKNIIHNNPEKFYSNVELATQCNVSVKTAENQFKKMFNTTIHQYILIFKIEEALSYFKNYPKMTIKEISYNLGFYDEFHFSKQFKKIMHISPSEYKKTL